MRNEPMNRKQVRLAETGRTAPGRPAPLQPVWFEHISETAREVTIVGSFNNWDVESTRMVHLIGGRWLRVVFLPPGRHEYLFVVDGRCVADPCATESVPNVFGCVNSVVSVSARAPRSGCARIIGRKPVTQLRAAAKLISRSCRSTNARQTSPVRGANTGERNFTTTQPQVSPVTQNENRNTRK